MPSSKESRHNLYLHKGLPAFSIFPNTRDRLPRMSAEAERNFKHPIKISISRFRCERQIHANHGHRDELHNSRFTLCLSHTHMFFASALAVVGYLRMLTMFIRSGLSRAGILEPQFGYTFWARKLLSRFRIGTVASLRLSIRNVGRRILRSP